MSEIFTKSCRLLLLPTPTPQPWLPGIQPTAPTLGLPRTRPKPLPHSSRSRIIRSEKAFYPRPSVSSQPPLVNLATPHSTSGTQESSPPPVASVDVPPVDGHTPVDVDLAPNVSHPVPDQVSAFEKVRKHWTTRSSRPASPPESTPSPFLFARNHWANITSKNC